MSGIPRINARRWYLWALVCVWVIMILISAGMLIAGKAQLFPDIAVVFGLLAALTILQLLILLVTGWVSRFINRGIDKAVEAIKGEDD